MPLKAVAVVLLTVFSVGWFTFNMRKVIHLILSGQKEMLWDRISERIQGVFRYVFAHKKVLEDPKSGVMHMSFFYGFLVLGAGHTEHVLTGMTTGILSTPFTFDFLPEPLFHAFLLSQDAFAAAVIVFGFYALVRRWFHLVPRLEPRSRDAETILLFIVGLYITFFGYTGTNVAMGGPAGWFRFASVVASKPFVGMSPETLQGLHETFYWAHLLVFLGFLNYLPFSKHAHIMAAAPNILFRRWGPRGKPSIINFETAEAYGIDTVNKFSWKTLLDGFACTECGRCNSVCPAHLTGKPLQPRKVIHDIKENLHLNHAALIKVSAAAAAGAPESTGGAEAATASSGLPHALISKAAVKRDGAEGEVSVDKLGGYSSHGAVHVDEAWACTTCGACMEICPVLIETVPSSLMEMRRHLVMMESDFPQEMAPTFKNMEGQGNPWGVPQSEREKWAEGLDVPLMRDKQEVDVLFWVGCAGATDDRAKKTQRALVQVMKASGVNFAIMGCEEKCTGDPARRMGNEYVFQNLCTENQAAISQYKFKEIVTTCPHCLNSLKNEYPDYGAPQWKVRHHTELLDELLAQNKVPLKKDAPAEKITFHDPCYLGRYNATYEAPRTSLKVLNNVELVEMPRSKETSFCCGAGGGRMFMEEHIGKRVNIERTEQAMATGASTVAVGCPFCMTMITDGTKAKGAEENVKVKDVAEIVASRLSNPS
ncbi:MAG: heterodisulfide reductase-related iron-sulfur binding cluster [Myxococcota bacterium]